MAALVVVALVALASLAWPRVRPLPARPLVIGFEHDPPYHSRGADGRPQGMAVEIVSDAARRIGLNLEWRHFPGSSWTLVRDGQSDLWPLMVDLPERRGHVHISAPYLTSDFYVLLLDGTPIPGADYAGEVGAQSVPVMTYFLGRTFPKGKRRPYAATHDVVEAVCRGEVPIGLVSIGTAAATLRLPPATCQKPLRSVKFPNVSIALGVGASTQFGWVADRLRREIATMSRDGTLSGILMPYSITATTEVLSAIEVVEAHREARALQWGMSLAAAALIAVTALSVALLRSKRKVIASHAAQRELEARLRDREHLEAIGRLAGGIAHDFNNVMTVIGGYAELALATTPPSDPRRTSLVEIGNAASRAASLVRQLLAVGRQQVSRPERVSVHDTVAGVESMLRRLLREDISLEINRRTADDVVLVDPGQLQQVTLNLATNARDAMPGGGRLVFDTDTVALSESDANALKLGPGRYVRLRVTDTGSGMDDETRRHAFEPFYTTKAFGQGAGLGLASVYGVVTQAGGEATISSVPGEGTTIDLYLPTADPPASS
jgi:signal transduction histidine kinase